MSIIISSLILFQRSNDSPVPALICCGLPLLLIIGIVILLVKESIKNSKRREELLRQQKLELEKARDNYYKSLEKLKMNPTNANLKQSALYLGRKYSELTRQFQSGDKTITIYDEVALMNDINAVCAGAVVYSSENTISSMTIEQRLAKLDELKEIGLLKEQEYEERRKKILDEL